MLYKHYRLFKKIPGLTRHMAVLYNGVGAA